VRTIGPPVSIGIVL